MNKGKIFKILFFIMTFMLGSAYLFAQGSEDDKKKAKKFFSEGVSYFGSGKHAQALEAFQKSYKLRPHWAIRYNLGLCYKELGMYTKAKVEFLDFLEEGGKDVKAATKEEVEKELSILNDIIAALEIDVNVQGSSISMDGKPVGTSPLPDKLEMDPGSHLITIKHEGYESYEEDFILSKGERKSFKVSLLPVQKPKGTGVDEGEGKKKDKDKKKEKEGAKKEKDEKPDKVIKSGARQKWALPVFITSTVLTVGFIAGGSACLGLAFGQKGKIDDLDDQMRSGHYPGTYSEYEAERLDIADKGKLYANLILLYIGAVFIVPAIVAVVIGHPFAKKETERPPAAREKILESMGVALVPAGRETTLMLSFNF